ncbi:RICIN domain-containing protein [Actinacidiphila glaucinigra]|uniref:RICIN domain-containing protein n=1 Tax=Actinacidiphila glaucinigra TaxID=235986 RepID=UPI0033A65C5E
MSLSTAAVIATASPASAADNRCSDKYGSAWNAGGRPQWMGAVGATTSRGVRMVTELSGPSLSDGAPVNIWENRNDTPQLWCFKNEGKVGSYSYYRIRNLYTGKCIDIQGPWTGDGVRVHQWNCSGYVYLSSQQWVMIPHGTKWIEGSYKTVYEWQNRFNGGSLDVANYGTANGSYTHVWHYNGTANQLWY